MNIDWRIVYYVVYTQGRGRERECLLWQPPIGENDDYDNENSWISSCEWLFFQNVIQVQPHGGKNPIVLYQELWLQVFSQGMSCLGMRLARRWTCVFLWIAIVFRSSVRGTWPVEPFHGGCSRLQADMTEHLQPHFLVQYNGGFTTMWLYYNHVLEK